MQVVLEKQYPIEAPLDAAWAVLIDIPELASCMPGAQITERIGENQYKGSVKVKVGPATAVFTGELEILEVDASSRTLRMIGKGADKGGSTASMELTATLVSGDGGTTQLMGKADVIVNGKFAQFGGRMLNSVSDVLLAQFAANFSEKAKSRVAGSPPTPLTEGEKGEAETAQDQAESSAQSRRVASPPVKELNLLWLLWSMLRNFFVGLFRRRHT